MQNKMVVNDNKNTGPLAADTTAQLVVLTVDSTDGEDISDYAVEVGRKWGIGSKDKNNGVLIVLSVSDRKVWVAVGYGLEGRLPDAVLACVGGGSNAIGTFYNFIDDKDVQLIGCEAAGRGINTAETAATIATGRLGIFHGMKSYFCQDEYGQIAPVYSISAGLDYPGIGPEHANLYDTGRAQYVPVTDDEAVDAFEYLSRIEGIIPAIESAHAVAHARKIVPQMDKDQIVVITISGRGDKDCAAIARYRGEDIHE